jgi:hypothetical protein
MTYQDNQLNQTLATHERTNGEAFPPKHASPSCSDRSTDKLGEEGHRNDANHVSPDNTAVEKANVGVEARKCKVQWQEESSDQILNLLCNFDGESTFVGTDEAGHESSENGVHTNDASKESTSKTKQECKCDHALTWAILESAISAKNPDEGGSNEVHQEQDEAKTGQ